MNPLRNFAAVHWLSSEKNVLTACATVDLPPPPLGRLGLISLPERNGLLRRPERHWRRAAIGPPLAMMPLRGFGGDGSRCRRDRKGSSNISHSTIPTKSAKRASRKGIAAIMKATGWLAGVVAQEALLDTPIGEDRGRMRLSCACRANGPNRNRRSLYRRPLSHDFGGYASDRARNRSQSVAWLAVRWENL
jgi:hypothetical protein